MAAAGAGRALSKATGTKGVRDVLSSSNSDGSTIGDARELVTHAKLGAKVGAGLGNAPGAVVGAAAGTAVAVARNNRTRRRLLILLMVPILCWVLVVSLVTVLAGSWTQQRQTRQQLAVQAAAVDGLDDSDVDAYLSAADSSGVQWTVLAAADRSAGAWLGPGQPPYGIQDLAAFNKALAAHTIDALRPEDAKDRVLAGYAVGRLLSALITEADPDVRPAEVDAGTGTLTDPNASDRLIRAVITDDADSVAAHEATRNAFVKALQNLPASISDDAAAIFDAAFLWSVGQSRACSDLNLPLVLGGAVPRPGGTGARLDVRVASWNVYYHSKVSETAAGLQQLAQQADVIGLQEFGPSRKKRAVLRRLPAGFDNWTTSGNMTGIVWRQSKYTLLAKGVQKNIGVVRVEEGASGTTLGPRYTLWVTLRQNDTGAVFTLINIHIVPTIDRGGRPDPSRPIRLALYRQQINQVAHLTDRFKRIGPVFVTGDFNIDAKSDARVKDPTWPLTQLERVGLYSNWRSLGYPGSGTHSGGRDGRWIDYVWSTSALAAPTRQQILFKSGSDHSALVVTESSQAMGTSSSSPSPQPSPDPSPSSSAVDAVSAQAGLPATLVAPGVTLRGEQISNAAVIIAEGKAAQVPAQGWVVALAAALQESGLRNLNYGDRDSVGLFQQRPSSGWGSVQQILDPRLSAQAFYGVAQHTGNPGLLDITGWPSMAVAVAAQAVQVSAFPSAYQKWEAAARSIVQQLDGSVPAGSGLIGTQNSTTSCTGAPALGGAAGLPALGSGPCPLDALHAPGKPNPASCNVALTYMQQQIDNGSTSWRRRCLALVAVAYGWAYSGTATAFEASQDVAAAGLLSTDRTNIPRGALMWWDGRAVGNTAGHVAIYDGVGGIYSNDVTTPGAVGRVPWTVPEERWRQRWLGWSPPYFPNGGGTSPAASLRVADTEAAAAVGASR